MCSANVTNIVRRKEVGSGEVIDLMILNFEILNLK